MHIANQAEHNITVYSNLHKHKTQLHFVTILLIGLHI